MKDRDYWIDSFVNIVLMAERAQLDFESDFVTKFDYYMNEVKSKVYEFFSAYQNDSGKVPYSDIRKYLKNSDYSDFIKEVKYYISQAKEKGMSEDFIDYLTAYSKRINIPRVEKLQVEIQYILNEIDNIKQDDIPTFLSDTYKAVYYTCFYTVGKGIETNLDFSALDQSEIDSIFDKKWAGRTFSDSLDMNISQISEALIKFIPQLFARGYTKDKVVESIQSKINPSKTQTISINRSQIDYTINQSSYKAFKVASLDKYEYCAILDYKTSKICRELNGFIGLLSQAEVGVNFPPMHVNCRSFIIPVIPADYKAKTDNQTRIWRSVTLNDWLQNNVPKEDGTIVLDYVKKYYKN